MIEGETYEVACPFVWSTYTDMDEEGFSEALTWRPGIIWQDVYPDTTEPVAHGVGKVFYTIISIHKLPRPYPARVFYTRKFETPEGRVFGKSRLHMTTTQAFKRRLDGYKPAGIDRDDEIKVEPLTEEEKAALLK